MMRKYISFIVLVAALSAGCHYFIPLTHRRNVRRLGIRFLVMRLRSR